MSRFTGKTLFISRHPGAVQWIKAQPIVIDRFIAHLDIEEIQPGDRVIGSLPVNLAGQVCARGAEYYNLSVKLPEQLRGQELTREQLDAMSATLERFCVQLQPSLL
ncbi:CRISPR-associated protein Csx16 [Vibrio metschnikovii]|nr:CRISPR-associated protein Csx16 [Vibrio metschnikovii]EKO3672268.1 CRISPR-associated protein Csx16 [Vibrio metschnikovii]EKO3688138.1 CRISPR-associated protein Csx16 [Vibrio metschnikovii]EKO3691537.1 CRISPR-associated protein Csx16 [Vibrio metschnikovii]EKO3693296.1 CRISPR-associated protein Csx16 [Vibrio metschnikovii]